MQDYLTLGPTPCEESCYPNTGDAKMQRIELTAYKEQCLRALYAHFGQENVVVGVVTKRFPHDFGSYSEVCVTYNTEEEVERDQAFWLEENCPDTWDTKAEAYLAAMNYIAYSN